MTKKKTSAIKVISACANLLIHTHYRMFSIKNLFRIMYFKFLLISKPLVKKKILIYHQTQFKSFDEISEINWEKRKSLVRYAYFNVPFYNYKYKKAGFHPDDLHNPEDFYKIPLLTRKEIRENLNYMISDKEDIRNMVLVGTGGTSGMPLYLYKPKQDNGTGYALGLRMLEWWGVKPIVNYATAYRVVNHSDEIIKTKKNVFDSIIKLLRNWLQKQIQIDASFMASIHIEDFINKIRKSQPEYIVGYVGAIDEIAKYLLEHNINLGYKLKAIWTTAAPLSKSTRFNIERSFKAPVFDQYGSIEVPFLAAECTQKTGLHFFYDARHIEFLDNKEYPTMPDVPGNVVVTDLENFSFPIIRYVNGDIGSWSKQKCNCGINLPLINNIQGRISDRVLLADGSSISGEFLTTIFDDYADQINGFQVHQRSLYKVEIKVIMVNDANFNDLKLKIIENLKKLHNGLIEFDFILVSEIPHFGGKLKYVINDLIKKE